MVKTIVICICELIALIIQIVQMIKSKKATDTYYSLNGCLALIFFICTLTSNRPIINIIGIAFAVIACYSFYLNDKKKEN